MDKKLKHLLIFCGILLFATLIFTLKRSKNVDKKYEQTLLKIEQAMKDWQEHYDHYLPKEKGESITLTLGLLKQQGFIDENLKNPKTKKKFPNDLLLTIMKEKEDFSYQVEQSSGTIGNYDETNKKAPILFLKGKAKEMVEVNEPYEDKGIVAFSKDGRKIDEENIYFYIGEKSVSHIDTSKFEIYTIRYEVGYAKEYAWIERQIEIEDTEKPKVSFDKITITPKEVAEFDFMMGANITDNSNEPLNITLSGTLASIPGKYLVTYMVEDSHHNKTTKKRVIIVDPS